MTKEEKLELLPNGTMGYFSTVKANGFPQTRFWQFQFEEDGKFYFATNNTKDVFVQILNNPKVGFTVSEPNGKYVIRIVGTAAIVTKPSEKEEAYSKMDKIVLSLYKSWSNPLLEIFYISD
ncbi:pyridoxamine 5'-phosphate oxidase family protein, partial [Clostridium estertheticum]|uniref:pyridoxamine 5'-phosphate oxidase family protein n=1 Tax=Clostridium estertheticum TaxID=238834 RepID=UPI001CF27EF9